MSSLLPTSGCPSPASAGRCSWALAGRHSPAPSCSSTPTKEALLHLLDLDDCKDEDSDNNFSLLNAPSAVSSLGRSTRSASACAAATPKGKSPVPVSSTPVCVGGRTRLSEGGGIGGCGGVGIVHPSTRALSCWPHKSKVNLQGLHPQ
jgi:hypothetical protein